MPDAPMIMDAPPSRAEVDAAHDAQEDDEEEEDDADMEVGFGCWLTKKTHRKRKTKKRKKT
jgi:hypothetical protein